jgi:sugar phosphate isomerase/epimerase
LLAPVARMAADPLGLPIGFQVFPVREAAAKDFAGTLKEIAGIGYRTIEMCSPPGYVSSGFGPLVNIKASEMKKIITDAGLRCESCHFGFRELKENLEDRIAYAEGLGLKQMVCSSFGLPNSAAMDDWKRAAAELNKVGERVSKVKMQVGFHNHDFEFHEIGGALIYDELMKAFDPKLVKMQFQCSVISRGYDPAVYLAKYPGRFCSLHLQDWSAQEKKQVAVGKGSIDWKKVFTEAKKAGVKNYFVEMDLGAMKESYPYLHSLKV